MSARSSDGKFVVVNPATSRPVTIPSLVSLTDPRYQVPQLTALSERPQIQILKRLVDGLAQAGERTDALCKQMAIWCRVQDGCRPDDNAFWNQANILFGFYGTKWDSPKIFKSEAVESYDDQMQRKSTGDGGTPYEWQQWMKAREEKRVVYMEERLFFFVLGLPVPKDHKAFRDLSREWVDLIDHISKVQKIDDFVDALYLTRDELRQRFWWMARKLPETPQEHFEYMCQKSRLFSQGMPLMAHVEGDDPSSFTDTKRTLSLILLNSILMLLWHYLHVDFKTVHIPAYVGFFAQYERYRVLRMQEGFLDPSLDGMALKATAGNLNQILFARPFFSMIDSGVRANHKALCLAMIRENGKCIDHVRRPMLLDEDVLMAAIRANVARAEYTLKYRISDNEGELRDVLTRNKNAIARAFVETGGLSAIRSFAQMRGDTAFIKELYDIYGNNEEVYMHSSPLLQMRVRNKLLVPIILKLGPGKGNGIWFAINSDPQQKWTRLDKKKLRLLRLRRQQVAQNEWYIFSKVFQDAKLLVAQAKNADEKPPSYWVLARPVHDMTRHQPILPAGTTATRVDGYGENTAEDGDLPMLT